MDYTFNHSSNHLFRERFLVADLPDKAKEDLAHVFVPTAPNPTSGMLILIPKKDLTILDMSVEDGMKFVISVGSVVPTWPSGQQKV